jgi:hypothetical protein
MSGFPHGFRYDSWHWWSVRLWTMGGTDGLHALRVARGVTLHFVLRARSKLTVQESCIARKFDFLELDNQEDLHHARDEDP